MNYLMKLTTVMLMIASGWAHADETPAVARGRIVYEHWCVACHGAGKARAGTMALAAKYDGTVPAELDLRTDLVPELVHYFLRNGVSIMPFFRKTEISPTEELDLIAYLRRNNP